MPKTAGEIQNILGYVGFSGSAGITPIRCRSIHLITWPAFSSLVDKNPPYYPSDRPLAQQPMD
jgi:hypothetical protein